MKSIQFSDGDIVFKDKRLQMVDGTEQKKQRTAELLKVVKGELFYNANIGLEYTEILDINEKGISEDRKKIAIMKALEYDDNIDKVLSIYISQSSHSNEKQIIGVLLEYKDGETAIVGEEIG